MKKFLRIRETEGMLSYTDLEEETYPSEIAPLRVQRPPKYLQLKFSSPKKKFIQ